MPKEDVAVVIVAGGTATRYNAGNKLLENVSGIPLIVYSVKAFSEINYITQIILVGNASYLEEYKKILTQYITKISIDFVIGGETRSQSVINGLKSIRKDITIAAIHDAARPLVTKELINDCYTSTLKYKSGVSASKINDTLKKTDNLNKVLKTVDRKNIWSIETPQFFLKDDIIAAYDYINKNKISVTDDAGAMESFSREVYLVESKTPNIKITHTKDLPIISYLLLC